MATNWREKFQAIRTRLLRRPSSKGISAEPNDGETRSAPPTPAPPSRSILPAHTPTPRERATVSINLGIDFGTSFTKVCFRDIGNEHSGIITFGGSSVYEAMIPTVVIVAPDGRLHLHGEPAAEKEIAVRYLKMRIAGLGFGAPLPEVGDIDLNDREPSHALAAWFLAEAISRAKAWIAENEADRTRGRNILWSANVGVPVEHYDSPSLAVFREILAVAWEWTTRVEPPPSNIADVIASYRATSVLIDPQRTDCHAVPEIAAAVQSFVMSREAVPGVYIYFDVGGGTLDGVAFNYLNRNGERTINFYSGKVDPFGVSAVAASVGLKQPGLVDTSLLDETMAKCNPELESDFAQRIRRCVAKVIMEAKQRDGRNWQESAIQHPDLVRKNIGPLDLNKMKPLVVFMGGGGAPSKWYRDTINSTYQRFGHRNVGLPPYHLREVSTPKDLDMNGLENVAFLRFAIAYGLSIPVGEGPDFRLPSQFEVPEPLPVWRPPYAADYADSKDLC